MPICQPFVQATGVTTHLETLLTYLNLIVEHLDVQKNGQRDHHQVPLQPERSNVAVEMVE